MNDDQLRAEVLEILGFTDATKEEQDTLLYHLESTATSRIALAIPELLSQNQLDQVQAMRDANEPEEKIMGWIETQLPNYDELLRNLILDLADEIAAENE